MTNDMLQRAAYIANALNYRDEHGNELTVPEAAMMIDFAFYAFDLSGHFVLSLERISERINRNSVAHVGVSAQMLERRGLIGRWRTENGAGATDGPGTPYAWHLNRPEGSCAPPRFQEGMELIREAAQKMNAGQMRPADVVVLARICFLADSLGRIALPEPEVAEALKRHRRTLKETDLPRLVQAQVGVEKWDTFPQEGRKPQLLAIKISAATAPLELPEPEVLPDELEAGPVGLMETLAEQAIAEIEAKDAPSAADDDDAPFGDPIPGREMAWLSTTHTTTRGIGLDDAF